MGDWIGLGLFVLVVVGALVGLSHLGRRPKPLTEEEYERRVAEAPGLLSAGVLSIQKVLDPGASKAEAVQQDLRAGYYDDQEEEGEGDEPGAESKRLGRTDGGGGDA
jgi:hypothetical protein